MLVAVLELEWPRTQAFLAKTLSRSCPKMAIVSLVLCSSMTLLITCCSTKAGLERTVWSYHREIQAHWSVVQYLENWSKMYLPHIQGNFSLFGNLLEVLDKANNSPNKILALGSVIKTVESPLFLFYRGLQQNDTTLSFEHYLLALLVLPSLL